jgi:hypothetical protein
MTHEPLCPINAQVDFDNFNLDNYLERYRCQCDLINLAYEQGWEAGYKQCDDEWSGKDRYN